MAKTSYGSWNNIERSSLTVEDSVAVALGDFAEDYDVDAVVADYRQAINDRLPEGVFLAGDEFYGPYPRQDVDLAEAVAAVDFWGIADRHDRTA